MADNLDFHEMTESESLLIGRDFGVVTDIETSPAGSLYVVLALFMDAIYLPVRPEGPREGVLVAWGFDLDGERVLLDVCLGQRERLDDWLELGRGLTARGLTEPLLVVSDGAPGLVRAISELWPGADRQRCAVHRLRNILAKLPKQPALHDRIRVAYWTDREVALEWPSQGTPSHPRTFTL